MRGGKSCRDVVAGRGGEKSEGGGIDPRRLNGCTPTPRLSCVRVHPPPKYPVRKYASRTKQHVTEYDNLTPTTPPAILHAFRHGE